MIEHQFKTFWRRLFALLIDWLIFTPLYYLDDWFYNQFYTPLVNFLYYALVSTLSFHIYSIVMHGQFGQTLGKMLMKVKVVSLKGEKLGYKRAILRDSVIVVIAVSIIVLEAQNYDVVKSIYQDMLGVHPVSIILMYVGFVWILLEFITMLTNNKRRAIQDFIAGSIVKRYDRTPTTPPIPQK